MRKRAKLFPQNGSFFRIDASCCIYYTYDHIKLGVLPPLRKTSPKGYILRAAMRYLKPCAYTRGRNAR